MNHMIRMVKSLQASLIRGVVRARTSHVKSALKQHAYRARFSRKHVHKQTHLLMHTENQYSKAISAGIEQHLHNPHTAREAYKTCS